MTLPYIELNRSFHLLSEEELADPDTLLALADSSLSIGAIDWPKILSWPRVLILAQGGVGKTREMQEQVGKLLREEKTAFFIPLETLNSESLRDALLPEETDRFEAWLKEEATRAWFFLDSVDELKLANGALERALRHFTNALGREALRRAHVILSSRPKDWSETVDRPAIEKCLALPLSNELNTLSAAQEFEAGLTRNSDQTHEMPEPHHADTELKIIMLLPLDRKRTRQFVSAMQVKDASAFMDEVTRRNADELVKRPIDLMTLIDMWQETGRLGTRREQLVQNIKVNLEETDGPHAGQALPPNQAKEGAERLALAMVLSKCTMIRANAPAVGEVATPATLNAEDILADWGPEERARLLRLPIFDIAAIGRVRFHHRSIKDFLAARRLQALREKNMPLRELRRLLFAEKYGVAVSIPSMRAISAWLAIWNDDIRQLLYEIAPQVLIADGDPESLPIADRSMLLKAFANAHGEGTWRGFGFDITQIRRLADPNLGSAVHDIWTAGQPNSEVRELLIDLIWHGPLRDCADLAEQTALDPKEDESIRSSAVRALLACNRDNAVQRFIDEVLIHAEQWHGNSFCYLLRELVPKHLSTDRLVTLVADYLTAHSRNRSIDWVLDEIVDSLQPLSDDAVGLRENLVTLIEAGTDKDIEPYNMKSRFGVLTSPLANLCTKQVNAEQNPNPSLFHACVIATRFIQDRYMDRDAQERLSDAIMSRANLREAAYWADVSYMKDRFPNLSSQHLAFSCTYDGALVRNLLPEDRAWLMDALHDRGNSNRIIALHRLINLWMSDNRPDSEFQELRQAAADDDALTQILDHIENPPSEDATVTALSERISRLTQEGKVRECERIRKWNEWREKICADPISSFQGQCEEEDIINLLKWLSMKTVRQVAEGVWSSELVRRTFGDNVLECANAAVKRYWRRHCPTLKSEKLPEEENTFLWSWAYGLNGVRAESANPGWTSHLSANEADIAVRYALFQFDGSPEFLSDLIDTHQETVKKVFSQELCAQFYNIKDTGALPILHDIWDGDARLRKLLYPNLLDLACRWPESVEAEKEVRAIEHLSLLLRTLCDANSETDKKPLSVLCRTRFQSSPSHPFSTQWLISLFRLDFSSACDLVTEIFTNPSNAVEKEGAIALLARIFGDRRESLLPPLEQPNRAVDLGRLMRFSYRFVPPSEDHFHDGVFSPDMRDHAESARSFIFSSLVETPGAAARLTIQELAAETPFSHISDRLRILSLEQIAKESEHQPFSASNIRNFEEYHELSPQNSTDLLDVLVGRLEDLTHDLHHSRFSLLKEWRAIENEADAQRLLANRLFEHQRSSYTALAREEQVVDGNHPDITVTTVPPNFEQVAIEIKIANQNRSANSLAKDINSQLVKKYLRHQSCKAGCFVVVHIGKRVWWQHPENKSRLNFSQLVEYLNQISENLEISYNNSIKLNVFGIDLFDPN